MTATVALQRLGATSDTADLLGCLGEDGAVIVEGAIDAPTVAAIRSELAPHLEASPVGRDDFTGHRTRRVGAIMARSIAARDLVVDPRLLEVAHGVLGPHGEGIQLHLTQLAAIGPGEGRQTLHRDRGVWGGHVPRDIETQLGTMWALTDFTEENGATRVVPGSHRWDDDRRAEPDQIVQATMPAGSVLLYTGSVLHSGGENRTGDVREGLLLHYTLDWLRQEENQYLSCPPEIAATFPPALQRLIGYEASFSMGFCSPPDGGELVSPTSILRRILD